jgi:hypothetical protein
MTSNTLRSRGFSLMEVQLFSIEIDTSNTGKVNIEGFGTEQGIQVRATVSDRDEVLDGPRDHYSISYLDILEMSDDIEKGHPKRGYGIAGSGLELNHWHWKRQDTS